MLEHGFLPLSKRDDKMHNILENYSSHNYVKIHSRLKLVEPFLNIFWEAIPSNPPAVKLNSVIRTARQRKRNVLQYLSSISKILRPYLNMDFFYKEPFIQAPFPPPIMIGCVT